jgi:hypothetical protein
MLPGEVFRTNLENIRQTAAQVGRAAEDSLGGLPIHEQQELATVLNQMSRVPVQRIDEIRQPLIEMEHPDLSIVPRLEIPAPRRGRCLDTYGGAELHLDLCR